MWLRLRQIAVVAHDIESVTADIQAVFGLEVGHIDPGVGTFGLENRIFPIGTQFLEVVAPTQEGTAGGRYLDRRGGDGGYMVITQTDQHAARKKRIRDLDIRTVAEGDGDEYCIMQLHPKDTGGSFFEIDWAIGGEKPGGPWSPAGKDWQAAIRTDVVSSISGVEIQSPEPKKVARRWSEIVEIPLKTDTHGNFVLELENAGIRFVEGSDGRPEGLGGIDVVAQDKERAISAAKERGLETFNDTVVVCGLRFYMR
jgi:hypothetical protein